MKEIEENNEKKNNENIKEIKKETIAKGFLTKERILAIVSAVILFICLIYIIIWIHQTKQNEKQMEELEKSILLENAQIEEQQTEEDETAKELIAQRNSIDFDKLYEINTDVIGWIKIDSLELNYPIMHYTDNDYYLGKNIYKEDSIAGSIFLDYMNNSLEDQKLIIFGHNMKNDSMFGKLDLIGKGECGTDVDIIIHTKEKSYKYKVFSTYEVVPSEIKRNTNIETMKKRSVMDFGKEVSDDSRILTLYTCTNATKEKTIVHSYLEREV